MDEHLYVLKSLHVEGNGVKYNTLVYKTTKIEFFLKVKNSLLINTVHLTHKHNTDIFNGLRKCILLDNLL